MTANLQDEGAGTCAGLIYYIHALGPLHIGTGVATGAIDLPHSREASTGLPNAPGSGIKGVLRDELKGAFSGGGMHARLFGAAHDATSRDQGALLFSDALLLCLPVPSYAGGFAWVTSPTVLRRYARERRACGLGDVQQASVAARRESQAACAANSPLLADGRLYLNDIALERADNQNGVTAIAQQIAQSLYGEKAGKDVDFFTKRFVVVADAVLAYLAMVAMDVRTRIAIQDGTRTVRRGGLWVEENLPAETVLWGSIAGDTLTYDADETLSGSQALEELRKVCGGFRRLQLGGKATVGRGIVRFVLEGT